MTAHQRMSGEDVPEFLESDGAPVPADASPGLRAARGEWFVERYAVAAAARAGGAVIIQERGETDALD